MRKLYRPNAKQLFTLALLLSLHGLSYAETYTSTVTTNEAWNQAWTPAGSTPVNRVVNGKDETYTFAGDSIYTGKTTLINTTTQNVKIVADSGNLTFSNWNIGDANYLITGYEVNIGSNTTFENITGNAVRASGSSTGPGGANKVTVGDNISFKNISSNTGTSNYGGAMYIFGPNTGAGEATFGQNFTISNVSFIDTGYAPFKGGAGIGVRRSMNLTFGNNALFEKNKVAVSATSAAAQGGAITGVGNTENVTAHNVFTFNGNATFRENSAVSTGTGGFAQGGAIALTRASGTPIKTGEVIFNGSSGTVTISNNLADASQQARGGAIFIGDGNLYIEAANIIIANNKTIAGTGASFGGAIYTATSDSTSQARGNTTIVGNANITGNIATSASGAAVGGAIFANGNINLKPNSTNNKIVFRDNQAADEGAAIQLNLANRKLFLDYTNSGTIEFYDRFNIIDGSQLLQSGNGTTRIWSDSWGGNININSGMLSIESAVTLANKSMVPARLMGRVD